MRASVCIIKSEITGARDVFHITQPMRLKEIAPKTDLPFICVYNGRPLLREGDSWDRKIDDGDIIGFVIRPNGGGGGSSPLKIVLMVALAVAAPGIGQAMAGSFGTSIGAFSSTFEMSSFFSSAISFVGKMAINALMGGTPKQPSAHATQTSASPSPTYNITAQGNRARLSEAIPEIFGEHLVFPDFGAEPYTEYAGNEQYLYQLFVVGRGEYDLADLKIEDTAIASFPEVTYEVVAPGAQVSLFPVNVATAAEVAGQELLNSGYVGGYIINPSGTQANYLGFDVVCGKGLFYANDNGGLDARSVQFRFEARTVNDAGVATGSWVTLGTETIYAATSTPQRRSYRYAVTKARYEARAIRIDAKDTSSRAGHDVMWASARAYLTGGQAYADVTTVAMRIRASNSLSSQSSRRFNLVAKRKLPIWNGTTWSAPTLTRNPAWVAAYICRQRMSDDKIDLAWLLAKSATWNTRGDYFDAVVDAETTWGEIMTNIMRSGRAKWFQHGPVIRFFRDEPQTIPTALFNMRNTVKGSFKTEYLMSGEETADSVIVEYFDRTRWQMDQVLCQLPGHYADKPAILKLYGVTTRAQAYREGMYEAACNRYRRMLPSLSTEMDGFIPLPGDLCAIQRDKPSWGQGGDVVAYDSGTKTLTLTEPLDWSAGGNHYFAFKKRDGSVSTPWQATAGVDAYHAVLVTALDFTPDTDNTRERTSYAFGPSTSFYQEVRMISVRPRGLERAELMFVNEDAAVHTADTGSVPASSANWNLISTITRPAVSGVNVTLSGTAQTPMLSVNWLPAANANNYHVEYSYDSGNSWLRAGDPTATNISFPAQRGSVTVRVRGVGMAHGDWATWIGDPYAAPPANVATFLVSVQPDGTREFSATMPGGIPPDFAGYKLRYRLGSSWTNWSDLYPMHDGLVTTSPFETNQLAAGTYTFAIKAVDDSGNESLAPTFIVGDLADPRLAGVLMHVLPHTQGWPGTKTTCHVEPEFNVLSANDTKTWADLTTWDAWTRWNLVPAGSMTYQHSDIDLGAVVSFTPLVSAIADGTQTIEEQHSSDGTTWTTWTAPGVHISARYIRIRITVAGAFPRMYMMDIKLNGAVVEEDIQDLNTSTLTGAHRIGVGDIRLPIVRSYSIITQVMATLQNVGPGWSWELIDKDTSVGPRIKIYNASNALADAVIDIPSLKGF